MPRATLRTRCGREVAIAYRLHSIETVSEAALHGRVTAPPSAAVSIFHPHTGTCQSKAPHVKSVTECDGLHQFRRCTSHP